MTVFVVSAGDVPKTARKAYDNFDAADKAARRVFRMQRAASVWVMPASSKLHPIEAAVYSISETGLYADITMAGCAYA